MTQDRESFSDLPEGPAPDPGLTEEAATSLAARVASRFDLPAPLEAWDFPEKGNINQHTFLVSAGRPPDRREFLLQRINREVFARPRNVLAAMVACLEAQRRGQEAGRVPPGRQWERITLVPTREGKPWLEQETRRGMTWWRLMVKIPDCATYKSLGEVRGRDRQLAISAEAGRGLALFGDLTADMETADLASPLPGYRDTRLYFAQLESVLAGHRDAESAGAILPEDPLLRESTGRHFLVHVAPAEHERRVASPELRRWIELLLRERSFATGLQAALEKGVIRRVAIHGDTKLDNFLFDASSGKVKALVDLDTIMPHTWLSDWGDMVRSLSNVAGEREEDLSRVQVDMEVYEALATGFLDTASRVTEAEVDRMVEAVETIALELGLRFLTDYLRGNSYFVLSPADPPALNRTRGLVQLTLFERLRERRDRAREIIERRRRACAS